eukprot:scaffold115761_cov28-Tisochrysis_lutea.AAC.2
MRLCLCHNTCAHAPMLSLISDFYLLLARLLERRCRWQNLEFPAPRPRPRSRTLHACFCLTRSHVTTYRIPSRVPSSPLRKSCVHTAKASHGKCKCSLP